MASALQIVDYLPSLCSDLMRTAGHATIDAACLGRVLAFQAHAKTE